MSFLPADFAVFDGIDTDPIPDRTQHPRTYDFDFEAGEFVTAADGTVAVLDPYDSFRQAIEKVLRTRRARFLAYSLAYGQDVGAYLDTDPAASPTRDGLLAGYVIDALQSHPGVDQVLSVDVDVIDVSTNEVRIQADLVDTFGVTVSIDHTLNA